MNYDAILQTLDEVAAAQDGCLSIDQLDAAALSADSLATLTARGDLSRVVPGVFVRSTGMLTERQAIRVGLLAGGPGSAASHWTAAALHGLMDAPPDEVWITSPNRQTPRMIETLLPVASTGRPTTIYLVAAGAEL